jgi:hypothetical protein
MYGEFILKTWHHIIVMDFVHNTEEENKTT